MEQESEPGLELEPFQTRNIKIKMPSGITLVKLISPVSSDSYLFYVLVRQHFKIYFALIDLVSPSRQTANIVFTTLLADSHDELRLKMMGNDSLIFLPPTNNIITVIFPLD